MKQFIQLSIVLWSNRLIERATWKTKCEMKEQYLYLFKHNYKKFRGSLTFNTNIFEVSF